MAPYSADARGSFAHALWCHLDTPLLTHWLSLNRPCFLLTRLACLPSLLPTAVASLRAKECQSTLKATAAQSEGAKVLLELVGLAKKKI
ncbi:hypothetical protein B484DRAFT_460409 [Ochromonadaceae sp. CCMP2298]|nr:hypothetical protein B484DRAFT_460409 [Ochromonadaceae sp. CCMP2298]